MESTSPTPANVSLPMPIESILRRDSTIPASWPVRATALASVGSSRYQQHSPGLHGPIDLRQPTPLRGRSIRVAAGWAPNEC